MRYRRSQSLASRSPEADTARCLGAEVADEQKLFGFAFFKILKCVVERTHNIDFYPGTPLVIRIALEIISIFTVTIIAETIVISKCIVFALNLTVKITVFKIICLSEPLVCLILSANSTGT